MEYKSIKYNPKNKKTEIIKRSTNLLAVYINKLKTELESQRCRYKYDSECPTGFYAPIIGNIASALIVFHVLGSFHSIILCIVITLISYALLALYALPRYKTMFWTLFVLVTMMHGFVYYEVPKLAKEHCYHCNVLDGTCFFNEEYHFIDYPERDKSINEFVWDKAFMNKETAVVRKNKLKFN